jgi:membrane protein DedA with SNARE-associated domain
MSKRTARILTLVIALAALAAILFGLRSYGSFLLLRSAYEVGRPQVSSLRAWMTLDHVAATYRVPADKLIARLDLPPATNRDDSLKAIADRRGISRFDFVRQAQRAIGASAPSAGGEDKTQGGFGDRVLSAVLAYGYPALAATLLLGAVGLPVPTGLVTVLAGSLAALGEIQWLWAAVIAIVASMAGDAIAFLIGRLIGENFLISHGRWIGYSPARFARVQALFARWGGLTVLFTRTLVSHLSSLASLLAGLSRYRWSSFLLFSGLGRLAWTSAYLGLGFAIGSNIDAASQFLGNLSGLMVSLAVLAVATITRSGLLGRPAA